MFKGQKSVHTVLSFFWEITRYGKLTDKEGESQQEKSDIRSSKHVPKKHGPKRWGIHHLWQPQD